MKYLFVFAICLFAFSSCEILGDEEEMMEPEKLPFAVFEMDKTECQVPCTVNFSSFSIASSCEWDFGDSTPLSNDCNPTHTFTEPGEFEVRFKVSNSSGATDVASQIISVMDVTSGDGSHPISGIKTFPNLVNTAALKTIEVEGGFICLVGVYTSTSPFSNRPEQSYLVKFDYSGESITERNMGAFIGLDMTQTIDGRIFLCGQLNNSGVAYEVHGNLETIRTYQSNRTGSIFTSIDYNATNEVFLAGFQESTADRAALIVKLRSSFSELAEWYSSNPGSNFQFDNVKSHGASVYFNAYDPDQFKSILYKMDDDLSDVEALLNLEETNIVDIDIIDDVLFVPSIRPTGYLSEIAQYNLDLQFEEFNAIAIGGSNDRLFPVDIDVIDGHYLMSSFIANSDPDCILNPALQRVCVSGTRCDTQVIECLDDYTATFINQTIQFDNGEFLAVGVSAKEGPEYHMTLFALDRDFEVKY